jgi:predicted house-cleaning NTP pyrophosphatase (Maf/HAM1 superfamily)
MNDKFKAVSVTWFRAAAASAIALYLAGETDPKKLGAAAIAGFAGPLLKWLDPNAKEFGRGSKK